MSSSQSQNSNQLQWSSGSQTTTPWDVQTPYLTSAFQNAQNAYNTTMANGPYTGDYVATDNGQGQTAFNQAFNFGTNAGNQQNLVGNTINGSGQLLNAGVGATQAGMQGLQGLSGDQTQNIINNAGLYADNPYISGAVQAAMTDANRQASESTIPNLYRSAAGSNALNSDRAALSQGVVERGLNDLAGNISANMRYNAYGKGIDTAKGELDSRRQSYGALSQLGNAAANTGITGLAQGLENQSRLNQMGAAGAAGNQQLRQDVLDNAMAQYQGKTNFPWEALNNYYNIIGNKSWGGTTNWNSVGGQQGNTFTQSTPSPQSVAGGILGTVGSFLGNRANGSSGLFGFL